MSEMTDTRTNNEIVTASADLAATGELHPDAVAWLEKARDFTKEQRDAAAKSGAALPDGSFPIENTGDLHNALRALGRAHDIPAAKAHIKKRAAALGATGMLPDSWK